MLKKINAGSVESDAGFSMQIMHPDYLEYKEGQNCLPISMGYDLKSQIIYIYVSNIKNLTIIEKNKIAKNIKEAVKLLDRHFEIIV